MTQIVNVNGFEIEVIEMGDNWAVSNKQVAEAFGVSVEAIYKHKQRSEFKQGLHFELVDNLSNGQKQTLWTKKGVITLGFKLSETPQTIAFRDWASDYILKPQKALSDDEIVYKALLITNEKVQQLQHKIEQDKPLVSFAQSVQISTNSMLIRDWAKSIGLKEKECRAWLNQKGHIYLNKQSEWRMYASDNGYFEQVPRTLSTNTRGVVTKYTVCITGKGMTALTEKILANEINQFLPQN